MSELVCIPEDELRAFSLGFVSEERSDEIVSHLATCPNCEETVSGFDRTADSLVASLKVAGQSADDSSDPSPDEMPVDASGIEMRRAIRNVGELLDSNEQPSAAASLPPAERIRDYELLETLGSGGMGTVYRAVHTRLERVVALKLLPARRLRDRAAVTRFEREMKAIGRLDHPTIVRATDAGEAEGTHFLAMDFVEGIDLARLVRLTGPMSVANACEVVRQAAIGLQYAHNQNLIHRDVKPSNLMLTLSGQVRILDLGLALFGSASEAVDELTTVGQLMGTLEYMAPEQCDNSHLVDARADIYSLGATLFKLLTGRAPYDASDRRSPLQKMKALATVDAPSLASCERDLPTELVAIVDRMLLRDPAARFASAAEVSEVLAPYCSGQTLATLANEASNKATQEADEQSRLIPRDPPRLSGSAAQRTPPECAAPVLQHDDAPAERPATVLRTDQSDNGNRRNGSSRGGRRLVTAAILGGLLLFAGVMIWLKTDTGTLLIECADESVPIEIRSGQKVVQRETLTSGRNSVTIRSGQYEIVLPQEYDALKVEDGRFELSRGGVWIARVTKQNKPHVPSPMTDMPGMMGPGDSSAMHPGMGRASGTPMGETPPDAAAAFGNVVDGNGSMPGTESTAASDVLQRSTGLRFSDPVLEIEYEQLKDEYRQALKNLPQVKGFVALYRRSYGEDHAMVTDAVRQVEELEKHIVELRDKLTRFLQTNAPDQSRSPSTGAGREVAASVMAGASLGSPMSSGTSPPLFSGKTFEDWKATVLTERNPVELRNAVMALCILGRNQRDAEAAETVLKVMDSYPCDARRSTPESELVAAIIRYLRTLKPEAIIPPICAALESGGDNVRTMILQYLASNVSYGGDVVQHDLGNAEPLAGQLKRASLFRDALLAAFPKLDRGGPYNSEAAIAFSYLDSFVDGTNTDPRLLEFFRQIVRDTSLEPYRLHAALRLAELAPTPELSEYFVDRLEASLHSRPSRGGDGGQRDGAAWLHERWDAWRGLILLGDKAAPIVPRLVKLLETPQGDPQAMLLSQTALLMIDHAVEGSDVSSEQPLFVSPRILILEVLAGLGPHAKSAVGQIEREIKSIPGCESFGSGTFSFESTRQDVLRQHIQVQFGPPGSVGGFGVDGFGVGGFGGGGFGGGGFGGGAIPGGMVGVDATLTSIAALAEEWNHLNSALFAWQKITGKAPLFADANFVDLANTHPQWSPRGRSSGGFASGMPAAVAPVSGNPDVTGGTALIPGAWSPRLVAWREVTLEKWAAMEPLTDLSVSDLNEALKAVPAVKIDPSQTELAAKLEARLQAELKKRMPARP